MDSMDNLLMTYRDMTARDWLVDAAVTLAALYVGYRVMGVAGMIVFPLLSVFCCQIYRALMEKTPEGQNASSRAGKPERAN